MACLAKQPAGRLRTIHFLAFVLTLALALSVPASAQAVYKAFRMPSNNIGCAYTDNPHYLRCDILQRNSTPRRHRGCEFDWGHGFALNRTGKARRLCVSDTVVDRRSPVLNYGHTKRIGGFTCTSRTTGLTCANKSGHGFFLSRERVTLF